MSRDWKKAKVKRAIGKKRMELFGDELLEVPFVVDVNEVPYGDFRYDPCRECAYFGKGPCHCTLPYLYNPINMGMVN